MNTLRRGTVEYRSKATARDLAFSFAKCLEANRTRFTDVEVRRSTRSKTEKWFVAFQPVSASRQAELVADQLKARETRAAEREYIFWTENGLIHCYSFNSGDIHVLRGRTCTCGDWEFRCRAAGLPCTHQIAYRNGLRDGSIS